MDIQILETKVERAVQDLRRCRTEVGRRIVGQLRLIDGLLMGILAGGHILVEGVPGLAKTLSVKTISEAIDVRYKRLQFTPDLLPADLTGTMIYRQETGEFIPRKGPVFSNIVIADEINRAPAKVQSALLEAMEERQVTIGSNTYPLPDPFIVMATQNPIENEGTYALPEAQLDRFLLKLRINYPSPEEELAILRKMGVESNIVVRKVLNPEQITNLKGIVSSIQVDARIEEYIVNIVTASREQDRDRFAYARLIDYGASTRATLYLYRCAKIMALFDGRTFVIPDDVKAVAYDVLRHRISLSFEAESEELTPENVIDQILRIVPVP